MKTKMMYFLVVAILITGTSACLCGDSNIGTKVGEQDKSPAVSPSAISIYGIGEVIQVKNHTIVLNSATFVGNRLTANFTIENLGSTDLAISSIIDFTARDNEGNRLEEDIFDCSPSLGGTILPGDKIKGNICWDGAVTESIKIYYEASLFGSGAIVWEVRK